MKGPLALAAAMSLLVVTLALLGAWWRGPVSEPVRTPTGAPIATETERASGFGQYVSQGRKLKEPPASWLGTVPDGALREDSQGNLIISEQVRRRFDYFLSALGEEELNVLRGRVAAHLEAALSEAAARQAWDLFERYIGYRAALRRLTEHDGSVDGMRRGLEERRALRDQWFSAATSEAFFGFRDRYAVFALERREILENNRLDPDDKTARLEALEAGLPEGMREMVRAERLGDLDRRRERWRERYRTYQEQRRAIENSGLADTDREVAVQRLRESLFDETEQRRVQVLDRIEE